MISLLQLIANLTNEAQQKDLFKNFALVNKPLGNSRSNKQSSQRHNNGHGHNNGRGKGGGGISRGTLLGNQGPAKNASNKYK